MNWFKLNIACILIASVFINDKLSAASNHYDNEFISYKKSYLNFSSINEKKASDFINKYGPISILIDSDKSGSIQCENANINLQILSFNEFNIKQALLNFLNENYSIFKIDTKSLKLTRFEFVNDTYYVDYTQIVDNIPVLFSDLRFKISSSGKLTSFRVDYISEFNKEAFKFDKNYSSALIANKYKSLRIKDIYAPKYWYPVYESGSVVLKPVLKYTLLDENSNLISDVYSNANTGEELFKQNLINSSESYKVSAMVKDKDQAAAEVETPLPFLFFEADATKYTTDAMGIGSFIINKSPLVTSRLEGLYAKVKSTGLNDAAYTDFCTPGKEFKLVWNDENSHAYQRNAYYYAARAHDFWKKLDTNLKFLDVQFLVNLEYKDLDGVNSPNAFSGGTMITFSDLQDKSVQMPNCPSIFYHEYGHSVNRFFFEEKTSKSMLNDACNEATADVSAVIITDDSKIGKGYLTKSPNSYIRDIYNDITFPINMTGESHLDGRILGGAFGDMRKSLGTDKIAKLFAKARYGIPDNLNTATAFYMWFLEILKADDDNANLADATPNAGEIAKAFTKHGIGVNLIYALNFTLEYPGEAKPGEPINVSINAGNNPISSMKPDSCDFVYRIISNKTGEFVFKKAQLSNDSKKFVCEFPALSKGEYIEFYYTIYDKLTGMALPVYYGDKSDKYFTIEAGYTTRYSQSFENQSWNSGAADDNSTNTTWNRVKPSKSISPYYGLLRLGQAAEGNYCYTTCADTSLSGLPENIANKFPNGSTSLISPAYTILAKELPAVKFKYFLSDNPLFLENEQGVLGEHPKVSVEYSLNGGAWVVLDSLPGQTQWTKYFKRLPLNPDFNGIVQIRLRYNCSKYKDLGSNSASVLMFDDFAIMDTTGIVKVNEEFALNSNANVTPNPFTEKTIIETNNCNEILILNLFGETINKIYSKTENSGKYVFEWDGKNLYGENVAAGTYFIYDNINKKKLSQIIKN